MPPSSDRMPPGARAPSKKKVRATLHHATSSDSDDSRRAGISWSTWCPPAAVATCGYATAASPCASLSGLSPWSSHAPSVQACGSGGGPPALANKLSAACTPLEGKAEPPYKEGSSKLMQGQGNSMYAHRAVCRDAAHVDPRLEPYFGGLRSTQHSLAPVHSEDTKQGTSRCPCAHAPALGTPGRRTSSACRCGRRAQSAATAPPVRGLEAEVTAQVLLQARLGEAGRAHVLRANDGSCPVPHHHIVAVLHPVAHRPVADALLAFLQLLQQPEIARHCRPAAQAQSVVEQQVAGITEPRENRVCTDNAGAVVRHHRGQPPRIPWASCVVFPSYRSHTESKRQGPEETDDQIASPRNNK